MYSVEALVPNLATPGGESWEPVHDVPQLDTEQSELHEARVKANLARRYYTNVRITKSVNGLRSVIA